MMSTAVMVKLGRVHGNLMVSLQPVSKKLKERAKRILMMETGISYERASQLLEKANYNLIAAIVMAQAKVDYNTALSLLKKAGWIPTLAIELASKS